MSEEITEDYNFNDFAEYRQWLDDAPNPEWLQTRDIGSGKVHKFIPVFIQNANSDFMYREWYVISESYIPIQNGVIVTADVLRERLRTMINEFEVETSGSA